MATKRASLAELMGKTASRNASSGLALSQLPEILGDAMPELPHDAIGRHRLVRSLQQRFGPNFRSLPGVKSLMTEFDSKIKNAQLMTSLRAIKPRR